MSRGLFRRLNLYMTDYRHQLPSFLFPFLKSIVEEAKPTAAGEDMRMVIITFTHSSTFISQIQSAFNQLDRSTWNNSDCRLSCLRTPTEIWSILQNKSPTYYLRRIWINPTWQPFLYNCFFVIFNWATKNCDGNNRKVNEHVVHRPWDFLLLQKM